MSPARLVRVLAPFLLVTGLLAACSGTPEKTAPEPPPATSGVTVGDRPNIVLITTDDQTARELQWLPRTRRLLAKSGLRFDNMISPHPDCCAARAQVLTGQHAHNLGVRTSSPPWGGHQDFEPRTALPVWLQEAGYRTGFIGNYLHGYDDADGIEPGWDQWKPILGTLSDYHSFEQYDNANLVQFGPADYHTDVVAQQSAEMATGFSSTSEPFFMWASFLAPHGTCEGEPGPDCSGPALPAERHAEILGDARLPSLGSPAFNEADVSDKHRDVRRAPTVDPVAQQQLFTQRLRALAAVDEAVVGIVGALEAAGTLEETVIMFTSDNGHLFGEHRLVGNNAPYEGAIRVPLLMRGPDIPAGERRSQTVSTIDLAPTIAELAGARPMIDIDGRSLLGHVVEDRAQRDRALLLQAGSNGTDDTTAGHWRGVRTERYTLVRWQRPRFVELTDRLADPHQLTNVAADPRYRAVRRVLARQLEELEDCADSTCRTPVPRLPSPIR